MEDLDPYTLQIVYHFWDNDGQVLYTVAKNNIKSA